MIVDTHAHCYWDSMLPRIEEIVENMKSHNITHAVQIGCDIESSQKAIALARQFPGVFYATIWLHPETAQDQWTMNNEQWIILGIFEKLIQENKDVVVAVGECGLDFHYLDGSNNGKNSVDFSHLSDVAIRQIENQKKWWTAQWELAKKYNLPLVIHTRDARDETLKFMKENTIDRCVMHCFSEDWDFARELLEFSSEIYFSFSGILTYKNAEKIQEAAKKIPLERILIETDSPFLSPQTVRGTVNEPANTQYVLEKLCELREEWNEEIEKKIYENSNRVLPLLSLSYPHQ